MSGPQSGWPGWRGGAGAAAVRRMGAREAAAASPCTTQPLTVATAHTAAPQPSPAGWVTTVVSYLAQALVQ